MPSDTTRVRSIIAANPVLPKEAVSVWLKRNLNSRLLFHCPICQCPLFKFSGDIKTIVPGDASSEMDFPFVLKCKGNSVKYGRCQVEYSIEGYV